MNFYDSRKAVPGSQFSVLRKSTRRNTENWELRTLLIEFLQMAKSAGYGEHRQGNGSVVGHVNQKACGY